MDSASRLSKWKCYRKENLAFDHQLGPYNFVEWTASLIHYVLSITMSSYYLSVIVLSTEVNIARQVVTHSK